MVCRYPQQQGNLSARSDYSTSSSMMGEPPPGRQTILSSPPPKTAQGGAAKPGSRLSSANIASAAKGLINRTPLNNRSQGDPGADDSIIVSNPSGLAVLLSPAGSGSNSLNSSTAASVLGGIAPGQLGSPVPLLSTSSSKSFTAGVPSALRLHSSNSPVLGGPASPSRNVSFTDRQLPADVYSQLPSSASSTSSAINRPLPYKSGPGQPVKKVNACGVAAVLHCVC